MEFGSEEGPLEVEGGIEVEVEGEDLWTKCRTGGGLGSEMGSEKVGSEDGSEDWTMWGVGLGFCTEEGEELFGLID